MQKIIIIVTLMLGVQNVIFAQQQQTLNKLIQRVERNVDLDYFQEIALKFSNYVDQSNYKKQAKVAIRICSNDPIELALLKSAVFPSTTFQVFAGIGYFNSDVIVLKSSDCIASNKYLAATEVWAVLDNAELPPHDEKYFSNQITIKVVSSSDLTYAGNSKYLQNTRTLIREMKKDKSLSGYIFGLYMKRPNEINKKLRQVVNLLEKSSLPKARYHIETLQWVPDFYPSLNPISNRGKNPAFFLVKIGN